MESKKPFWILKWVLIVGIALVANLFFNYALAVVYDDPSYEDFCPQEQVRVIPETENECVLAGGQWTPGTFVYDRVYKEGAPVPEPATPGITEMKTRGYCDPDFSCRQAFDDARREFTRNIFIALTVAGVGLIIGSLFVAGVEAVSLGLSFGGVLAILTGAIRYWGDMNDYTRVAVLGVALIALIWVGVKKFRE